jgi:sugar lactone lactonase YvrE
MFSETLSVTKWRAALLLAALVSLSFGCSTGEPVASTGEAVAAVVPPPPPPAPPTPAATDATALVTATSPAANAGQPADATANTLAAAERSESSANPTGGSSAAPAEAAPADAAPADADAADAVQVAAEAPDGAAKAPVAGKLAHPFPRRAAIPEFSKDLVWLNSKPLTKKDLKGKFVLLDFWTYCCINCMHILPELKKLERQFPNNLVVIGVHSAKFEAEKETDNIREAILRYEIEHPVINDANHAVWDTYGVGSWPTLVVIDPEGNFVGNSAGEFKAPAVAAVINNALPYYRENKLLNEKPLKFDLEADKQEPTPLRFPGKILADEKGGRLFITDSNHNRIVIASLDGKLIETIGSGSIGREDGGFDSATFDHPQGCALNGEMLYVADTENHMIRKVDLKAKAVTTVAGTGDQAANPWPGWVNGALPVRKRFVGPPRTTELTSPWALWVHKTDLFIAMAGCHQIWRMPLDESEIGPHAGNAREDINDGPLLPAQPYRAGSSFAQPSGLSSDGTWLYVADSEGSSIRKVPFKHGTIEVGTVVGSNHLAAGSRLFAFGDKDGARADAKLQHCLDVDYLDGKLYVADTYNHKIKVVNAKTGVTKTFAGEGEAGKSDAPARFHEPGGVAHAKGQLYVADTNNHLIRVVDIASGKVSTLTIDGLTAPERRK